MTVSFRRGIIITGALLLLPIVIGMVILPRLFYSGGDQDDANTTEQDARQDKLAYVTDEGRLMLYDPRERSEILLLENVSDFALSQDGRIAFTKLDKDDTELYVLDPYKSDTPIQVSHNLASTNDPISWSPDGRYLAYAAYQVWQDQVLYVWDGEVSINVMPESLPSTVISFYEAWSYDGRLAYTVHFSSTYPNNFKSEKIYVWDGTKTTPFSPMSNGEIGGLSWSKNNQLMFGFYSEAVEGIFIWDGVSFANTLPDSSPFTQLPPELNPRGASWLDDGNVSFTVPYDVSLSGRDEMALWDVESQAIIKQWVISSDLDGSWFADGGQVVISTILASGSPSVFLDIEDTEGDILFSTHSGSFSWSPDYYLAFCERGDDYRIRVIYIWDGAETWEVARTSYRPIQWQNVGNTFSCNNG